MALISTGLAVYGTGKSIIGKLGGIFGGSGPSKGTQLRRRQLAALLQALAGVKDADANAQLESIIEEAGRDPKNQFWATSDQNKTILIQELRGLITGQGSRPFNRYAPYWTDSPTLSKVGAFLDKYAFLDQAGTSLAAWKGQIAEAIPVVTAQNIPGTLERAAQAAKTVIQADAAKVTSEILQGAGSTEFGNQVAAQYAQSSATQFLTTNKNQIVTGVVGTAIVSGLWWLGKKVFA